MIMVVVGGDVGYRVIRGWCDDHSDGEDDDYCHGNESLMVKVLVMMMMMMVARQVTVMMVMMINHGEPH